MRDFLNAIQFRSTYDLHNLFDQPTGLPYLLDPGYPRVITKEVRMHSLLINMNVIIVLKTNKQTNNEKTKQNKTINKKTRKYLKLT